MRKRDLKPGFFKNPELVELPFEYRILFEGLWCLADREGRLEDRAKRIRMEVFPADDVDCEAGLHALAGKRQIVRYEAEGNAYIWIPAFAEHQHPHPKEAPSVIPPYLGDTQALKQEDLFAPSDAPGDTKVVSIRAGSSGSSGPSGSSTPTGVAAPVAGKPGLKGHGEVTLKRFFEICREAGEEPIPVDDNIWAYAAKVGIPVDLMELTWRVFREKHLAKAKRYSDWRAVYRNAVKDNWYGLWSFDVSNQCVLTGKGRQAQKAHA